MSHNSNEQIELETADAHQFAELLDSLEKLYANPDFQKVILNGYMRDKALASVSLLAVDAVKKRGERPEVMEELVAISNLGQYFMTIQQLGAGARQSMVDEQMHGADVEEVVPELDE